MPSIWLSAEVTDVVMPLTVLVAVVTIAWVVPSIWVSAELTGAVTLLTVPPTAVTVPPTEVTVSLPVAASWVTVWSPAR